MITSKIIKNDYLVFAVFSAVWIFFGWIAFLSALGDFFYLWIFWGFLLLMIGVLTRQFVLKKVSAKISPEFAITSLFVLLFAIISSFFVTPTIFSGRDQGSISEAAIRLSQNHRLEFSTPASAQFFEMHGPGKALNFPGFYYDKSGNLITQFPIPYVSWLAAFHSVFGLSGLVIANAILLFIFLLSFYLLARLFLETKYAAALLAFTATSFPFFWFFKFTLSETIALVLLWLSILWTVLFLKEKRLFYYFSFLLSASLLVFTRIEGIFFLISGFLTIFILTKKESFWKEKRKFVLTYPAIFLFFISILNFAKDIYFYKEIGKVFLSFGNKSGNAQNIITFFSPLASELKIFYLYGLVGFALIGLAGALFFIKNKKWNLLSPLFIVAPSFVYLINPWISSDHPWMLRRFVFSILPAMLLYSILFLASWKKEKNIFHRNAIFYALIASFAFSNLFFFSNYFFFSENKSLLQETKKISENFENNDLILIDRLASGDGWSMMSGPMNFLYSKNAVYIFNPDDIKKINRSNFSRIYIVAQEEAAASYIKTLGEETIADTKDYFIQTKRLSSSEEKGSVAIPEKKNYEIQGKIIELKKLPD